MTCETYREHIALAVEGDLDVGTSRRLDEHLAACADCRRFKSELEASQRELKSWAAVAATDADREAFRSALMQKVEDEPGSPFWTSPRSWQIAAGLLLALGLLWWLASAGSKEVDQGAPTIVETPSAVPVVPPVTPEAPPGSPEPRIATRDPATKPQEPATRPDSAAGAPPRRATPPTTIATAQAGPSNPPSHHETTLVKLIVDDPDLVIYWLIDTPTSSKET